MAAAGVGPRRGVRPSFDARPCRPHPGSKQCCWAPSGWPTQNEKGQDDKRLKQKPQREELKEQLLTSCARLFSSASSASAAADDRFPLFLVEGGERIAMALRSPADFSRNVTFFARLTDSFRLGVLMARNCKRGFQSRLKVSMERLPAGLVTSFVDCAILPYIWVVSTNLQTQNSPDPTPKSRGLVKGSVFLMFCATGRIAISQNTFSEFFLP